MSALERRFSDWKREGGAVTDAGVKDVRGKCWRMRLLVPVGVVLCGMEMVGHAQVGTVDAVKSEVERCERRIKEVRAEIANQYEIELGKLRVLFQKAADLESALQVREEERRLSQERGLDPANLAQEPRALRELQEKWLGKQKELLNQVLEDSVPKLVDIKKQLTVAGRLDEALEIKGQISQLQSGTGPTQRVSSGERVSVEEVWQAYQTNRERADKMYRGVKLTFFGRVLGLRQDPREASALSLVLSGGADGAYVDCAFSSSDYRLTQQKQGAGMVISATPTSNRHGEGKFAVNTLTEILGKCEGWVDGGLRFSNCTVPRR